MTAKERATQFVRKYSNLFTEDHDFWIAAISVIILEAERDQMNEDKAATLKILGKAKS